MTLNEFEASYKLGVPKIVCLCGSTRFRELYRATNAQETLKGNIVLSVGCFAGDPEWGTNKVNLDELHKRKIDLADEVLVLTVDGYIGSSTRSEIEYAKGLAKPIRYIDEPGTAPEPTQAPTPGRLGSDILTPNEYQAVKAFLAQFRDDMELAEKQSAQ